jgi:hypothetical protein
MSEHQRATGETKMATDDHWGIDHTGMGVSNITKAMRSSLMPAVGRPAFNAKAEYRSVSTHKANTSQEDACT